MKGLIAVSDLLSSEWSTTLTPPFTPVKGGTLFYDRWPQTPDEALLLRETQGRPPERTFGADPAFRRATVQVWARAAKAGWGRCRDLIEAAETAVTATNATVTGGTVLRCHTVTEPHLVDYDPSERPLARFTAELWLSA